MWCEELTHWERLWCWERLKAGGERDKRGWDRWMPSPTRWTWVWVSPGNWWWTGKPGVLQHAVRVGHDPATELNYCTVCMYYVFCIHSSVNGHIGCFHILFFLNSATVNIKHACIFSNLSFVWIYAQEWYCWIIWQLYFWFSEEKGDEVSLKIFVHWQRSK